MNELEKAKQQQLIKEAAQIIKNIHAALDYIIETKKALRAKKAA